MAGAKCPKCGKLTVFRNPIGRACSQEDCGFMMKLPRANGKGGRGKKCMNCYRMTVHNDKCTSCGAENKY